MDKQTLENLAEFICGDGGPIYRTGSELTRFFQRVGFSNFVHDGSTRKWWTLSVLEQLSSNNLVAVILRLANPREYGGQKEAVQSAIKALNKILIIEGKRVVLKGITPSLIDVEPDLIENNTETELKPLPAPDFSQLEIDIKLGEILLNRWEEIQKCFDAGAYLAAIILMGSLLEAVLLSVMLKFPKESNTCKISPKDSAGKVKQFQDWTLSEMINIAHELNWINLDVKKFSHALRDFRNLIHPYQQMTLQTFPDKDSCDISWLVVQAAINDLSNKLK